MAAEPGFPLVRTPDDLAQLGDYPAIGFDAGNLRVTIPRLGPGQNMLFDENGPRMRIKIGDIGCSVLGEDIYTFVVHDHWIGWLNAAKRTMPNLRELRLIEFDMNDVRATKFGANFQRLVLDRCTNVDLATVDRWRSYGYQVEINH